GSASITADHTSPQKPGVTVVLTGGAVCAGAPQYRFWVRPPGGAWAVARDYSPTATFSWVTTNKKVGSYALEVDVRNTGATAAYRARCARRAAWTRPSSPPSSTATHVWRAWTTRTSKRACCCPPSPCASSTS